MKTDDIVRGIEKSMETSGNADYITMEEGMSLLTRTFSTLSGLAVGIILIIMPIVISIELFYINSPLCRDKVDRVLLATNGWRKDALNFVLRDAKLAVYRANTEQTGKSANWYYLLSKSRVVFVTVVLVVLVTDGGPLFFRFAWNLVGRFFGFGTT